MAQLAIKGHATRGKEVIEILEMLGGINYYDYSADNDGLCFYINKRTNVIDFDWVNNCYDDEDVFVFTLEKFLEKYPYKVGDKVKNARINDFVGRITKARWDDNENQIIYVVEWNDVTKSTLTHFARDLQPYKEETTPPCKFGFTKPLLKEIIKQTSSLAGFPIGISDIEIIVATSIGFRVCLVNGDKYLLKFK